MAKIISKTDGVVIAVPVDKWDAIHEQVAHLYLRLLESRDEDVMYHEDAYEKVGYASCAAGTLLNLLDSVQR